MKKKIYLFAAAALAMASCSEEDFVQQSNTGQLQKMEITASMPDGDSRTSFTDGGIKWQANDALSVFLGSGKNYKFVIADGVGENTATFAGEAQIGSNPNNVAYYPYAEDVTIASTTNGAYNISATFPTKQTWAADGSFGPNSLPMVAVNAASESEFQFKPLGGWLQLYVKGDTKITKVVMKAQGKKIAGKYTVTAAEEKTPAMTMAEDAVSYIALDCGEGVQLKTDEATLFTFAVAPFDFQAGEVSFDLYDNVGKYMPNAYVISKGGTVIANAYYTISASEPINYVGIEPPVQIGNVAYTSLECAIENAMENDVITLCSDITLATTVTVPEDKVITIDLNGKGLSMEESIITTTYAINNLGTLTLKDSKGEGSVTSRGIYNGYDVDENYVTTAKLIVESGTYNAMGTNGGAAVYNYGITDINGGTFESNGGYGLNSQSGSTMTINGAKIKGGVYMSGSTVTIGEGTDILQHLTGKHAVYVWQANLTVNGGEFDSNSGNELIIADGENAKVELNAGEFNKTAKSWLFGAATGKDITFTINGGTYNGYVNQPEMTVDGIRPYGDPIVVKGGTFNFNPENNLGEGYNVIPQGDLYVVGVGLTWSAFVQAVIDGEGTFDGEGKYVTIAVESGDARTETKEGLPNRLQKYSNPEVYYAQYQRFAGLNDVNISNVNFVFVPAAVTVTDAWNTAGATTTKDNINGELQFMNKGKVTLTGCTFELMSVSPIEATSVEVDNCTFNGLDAYAIKDIKAGTVTVNSSTFNDCNGGFWMNAAPTTLIVTDNKFLNVGRRGAVQFSAAGDYTGTTMTVTGNEVTGGAFLWQLNSTVTYNQVTAILDTEKNTYEIAYVDGSTIPQKPIASVNGVQFTSFEDAIDAVATTGGTVEVVPGEYTFPASKLAAGVTLDCAEGTVFTGEARADIKGATVIGATFENESGTSLTGTVNGTFKDCTFTGSNGLRWCYAGETSVFEDCVFDGDVYGAHFDGGSKALTFRRCTFSGFNAFGRAITQLTLEDCIFKSTGKSSYNGVNLWGNTKMTGTQFLFDGSVANEWVDICTSGIEVEFNSCTVNGQPIQKGQVGGYAGDGYSTLIINENSYVCVEKITGLNAAISDLDTEATVLLTDGTYEGHVDLTGKKLTLEAANKGQAIINGSVWADNCTVTLKGLKLTNPNGVQHPNPTNSQYYTTINNQYPLVGAYNFAHITMEECTFDLTGSTVYGFYGYAHNTPVFKNCTFNCNKIRPIASNGPALTVTGCTFNDQYHYSARIYENSEEKQTIVFTGNIIKGSNDKGEFEGINISKKATTATVLGEFTINGNTVSLKYRHHKDVTMSESCVYYTDITDFAFEKEQ